MTTRQAMWCRSIKRSMIRLYMEETVSYIKYERLIIVRMLTVVLLCSLHYDHSLLEYMRRHDQRDQIEPKGDEPMRDSHCSILNIVFAEWREILELEMILEELVVGGPDRCQQ